MHPYQIAINVINENGGKARPGQNPYRLLHKLAKAKDVYMHGSQPFIGKTFNISPSNMNKLAKKALEQYCISGVLQIPDEFKYNENRIYRHDGKAEANRNLWKDSNKTQSDRSRRVPVSYSFNTLGNK